MPKQTSGLPSVGDEIAGKYHVEQVIGEGGMGAVFAARNALTGRRVAIKWLLPEHAGSVVRERLLREAQLAASIEHPNVVNIYDVGEHQGGLFLVMEYLPGRPLSALMLERGLFEPRELISLIVPAMRGVHAAHAAGVIHRDLKPENIILSELEGEIVPKVVDFGVSKAIGASAIPSASLTRTGALVGTPHYMALEQIDGSGIVDPRTDIYAFGVLLYRGLTGSYPFDGSSLGEVILKIGMKPVRSMRTLRPELPAELDAVVLRALARDLRERFEDLEEFARALFPFALPAEGSTRPSWPGASRPPGSSGPVDQAARGSTPVPDVIAQPRTPMDGATVDVSAPPTRGRNRALAAAFAVATLLAATLLLLRRDAPQTLEPKPPTPPTSAVETAALERGQAREASPSEGAAPGREQAAALMSQPASQPGGESGLADLVAPPSERLVAPTSSEPGKSAAPLGGRQRERAASERGRSLAPLREQELSPARSGGAPVRIPGRRTNGLSVDEF